jgi:hypothetical protein
MSTTPEERSPASRAEARRRARLAARGELPEDDEVADEPVEAPRRGFLSRIFPPAPPLPGRPDPLAEFDRSGPLRPVRERIYLLRQNPAAWLLTGLAAFIGFFGSTALSSSPLSLVATFILFGALIAAGWFGWQRPTLYGTAAALVSFLVTISFILVQLAQLGVAQELSPTAIILDLTMRGLYQAGLGFLGGWYGGYLRRRQTQMNAETRRRR